MNASGIVMLMAAQILVPGRQEDRMSLNSWSLRYGVSMNICVWLCDAEIFSIARSLDLLSSVFAGR